MATFIHVLLVLVPSSKPVFILKKVVVLLSRT